MYLIAVFFVFRLPGQVRSVYFRVKSQSYMLFLANVNMDPSVVDPSEDKGKEYR